MIQTKTIMVNDATKHFNMRTLVSIMLLGFSKEGFGEGLIGTTAAFTPSLSTSMTMTTTTTTTTSSINEVNQKAWTTSRGNQFVNFPDQQNKQQITDNNPLQRPRYPNIIDTPNYYQTLIKWTMDKADTNSSSSSSSNVGVSIHPSKCGRGYGLYTNRNVKQDEIVFEIPSEKCLTLSQAWDHPTLGKAFRTMTDDDCDQNNAVLATYLASELLMEHKNANGDKNMSQFHSYLTTIPTEKGSKEQDHILWWTEKELISKFGEESPSYEGAMALREWVDDMRDIVTGLLVTDLNDKQKSDVSFSEVRNAITAAFVNVMSRSLRDDTIEDGQRMVPLLDMAQHSDKPNINYSTSSSSSGSVVVKATRDLKAGEELTMEYANELTDEEFFIVFGFVPLPVMAKEQSSSTINEVTVNGIKRDVSRKRVESLDDFAKWSDTRKVGASWTKRGGNYAFSVGRL